MAEKRLSTCFIRYSLLVAYVYIGKLKSHVLAKDVCKNSVKKFKNSYIKVYLRNCREKQPYTTCEFEGCGTVRNVFYIKYMNSNNLSYVMGLALAGVLMISISPSPESSNTFGVYI